jgi:hypothetical protein
MRKTILTILGSAFLAASLTQVATATERHKGHKVARAPAPVTEPFRNSNAYAWPGISPQSEQYWRYQNGALSAPAGR